MQVLTKIISVLTELLNGLWFIVYVSSEIRNFKPYFFANRKKGSLCDLISFLTCATCLTPDETQVSSAGHTESYGL